MLTGTLNITTDYEPFVIVVSNGSGTETDETDFFRQIQPEKRK